MINYYPWSEKVLNELLSGHDRGELASLDLDFTAKCTCASCIYCDSKPEVGKRHPNELDFYETENLIKNAKEFGLKWIYTCGLGEPLEDSRFKRLISAISKLGIRLSLFSNGILIDEKMAKFLHDNKVCLVIKLDTLNEKTFDQILGKKGQARKIYESIELLLKAGYGKNCENDFTDLAFSIVPTKLNIHDIFDVIEYAKKNNVFPSIGELEQAGRVLENKIHNDLALNKEEILNLKNNVENILWNGYTRPICPTIITGIHVDNVGKCVVDLETGLNCKWFLLNEPMVKEIGNVRQDKLEHIFSNVKEYRKMRFNADDSKVYDCESIDFVFGGCGGSPKKIIQIARQHL